MRPEMHEFIKEFSMANAKLEPLFAKLGDKGAEPAFLLKTLIEVVGLIHSS